MPHQYSAQSAHFSRVLSPPEESPQHFPHPFATPLLYRFIFMHCVLDVSGDVSREKKHFRSLFKEQFLFRLGGGSGGQVLIFAGKTNGTP